MDQALADEFHRQWYRERLSWSSTWRGIDIVKCPFDMWIMSELIFKLEPDLLIETGTWHGGSAHYYANLFDLVGKGQVVTIDVGNYMSVRHARVTQVIGDSATCDIPVPIQGTVMVCLDSDHSKGHVLKELDRFSQYVTPGSYLIVEDTNVAGHPVDEDWLDGDPYSAVEEWLPGHPEFERDQDCERYYLTQNPGGWLRRK